MKNIDHPLIKKPQPSRYQCHRFWTRKRANEGWEYIEIYTKKGELVLDPFSGSGIYPLEGVRLGRKAVFNDADPVASFIARMTFLPIDIDKLKNEFNKIASDIKDQIIELYLTKCKRCKKRTPINVTVYRKSSKNIKEYYPIEVRYKCQHCSNIEIRPPTKPELEKIEAISKQKITYWYPKQKIPPGVTFNQAIREGAETFADLFTKRNIYALSTIMKRISDIKDKDIRDMMKYTFTSMVHLCSRMTPDRESRPWSSHWARNDYWLPPKFQEGNV